MSCRNVEFGLGNLLRPNVKLTTRANRDWPAGPQVEFILFSSVELRGGSAAGEGNVFVDGLGVCDDLWEQVDAEVLCRFLTTVLLNIY